MEDFSAPMAKPTPPPESKSCANSSPNSASAYPAASAADKCAAATPVAAARPTPQLHGPYTYWTRKVGGRTIAQLLTAEQLERYQPWIENNHRLHQLTSELQTLSIQTAEQTEGWEPKQQPTGNRRRRR